MVALMNVRMDMAFSAVEGPESYPPHQHEQLNSLAGAKKRSALERMTARPMVRDGAADGARRSVTFYRRRRAQRRCRPGCLESDGLAAI